MNTHKKLLVLLLASATTPWVHGRFSFPNFDEIDEFFDKQWEEMHRMRKQMRNSMQSSSIMKSPISATIDDQDKKIVITINGIDAQDINARVNEENTVLTVTTPTDLIRILINGSLVAAEISHESKTATKDDKNKEQEVYSSFVTNTAQTVQGTPLLEQQTIDYDKENKELTITLPKKERGKTVAINHVTKLKKQSSSTKNEESHKNEPKK